MCLISDSFIDQTQENGKKKAVIMVDTQYNFTICGLFSCNKAAGRRGEKKAGSNDPALEYICLLGRCEGQTFTQQF